MSVTFCDLCLYRVATFQQTVRFLELRVFKGCNLNQRMPFPHRSAYECVCETYLDLSVCVCSMFLTNVLFLDLFKAQIYEYDILPYELSWRYLSALNFSPVSRCRPSSKLKQWSHPDCFVLDVVCRGYFFNFYKYISLMNDELTCMRTLHL